MYNIIFIFELQLVAVLIFPSFSDKNKQLEARQIFTGPISLIPYIHSGTSKAPFWGTGEITIISKHG